MGYVELGRCKENRRWRQGGRTAGPAVHELSQPSKSATRKTSKGRVEGGDRGGWREETGRVKGGDRGGWREETGEGGGGRQGRVEGGDRSDGGHVDEKVVMREVWE